MTFVQNQEITIPKNVGYITELIANYCYKGLRHNKLGPTSVNLFMFCSLHDINVFVWTFIVRRGNIVDVVIVHYFGLLCIRGTHLCVNRSPDPFNHSEGQSKCCYHCFAALKFVQCIDLRVCWWCPKINLMSLVVNEVVLYNAISPVSALQIGNPGSMTVWYSMRGWTIVR